MTQEDKQLLLVDLCARLPYGVKIRMIHHEIKGADPEYVDDVFSTTYYNMIDYDDDNYEFLPYLRPMSSMTEEEKSEFINYACYEVEESVNGRHYEYYLKDFVGTKEEPIANVDAIDWLNKNMFDYRGLIPKGLALEAPEGMYKS